MATVNGFRYTLSVTPKANGVDQTPVAVTSGESDDQTSMPFNAFDLAPLATKVFTPLAGGKGALIAADHKANVAFRVGGQSAVFGLNKYPSSTTPATPYQMGLFIPGSIACSQIAVTNVDLDDTIEVLTVGLVG